MPLILGLLGSTQVHTVQSSSAQHLFYTHHMMCKSWQFRQENLRARALWRVGLVHGRTMSGSQTNSGGSEEMTQRRRAKTATSSLQQIDTDHIAPYFVSACLPAAVLPNSTEYQARACQRYYGNEILRSQASTRQSGMSYNTDLAAAYAFFSLLLLPTQPR